MDGWQVAHRARELNPAIPVIYMTGAAAADWYANDVPKSILLNRWQCSNATAKQSTELTFSFSLIGLSVQRLRRSISVCSKRISGRLPLPVGSRFALHVRQASRFKSGAFNE
jgi:hypothetical protein